MIKLRDPSDFSIDEIADIALEAGLEARQQSLDAGCEVVSEDSQGRTVIDKKLSNGTIERTIKDGKTSDEKPV